MVKSLPSQCRGPRCNPWSRSWILNVAMKSAHAAAKHVHATAKDPADCMEDWRSCMLELRPSTAKKINVTLGSMHDTGCLGLVHWDDPEGGMGREEGGGFRMGNTCIPVVDSF